MWEIVKRTNFQIIEKEEGDETVVKSPKNMFNKVKEENFTILNKEVSVYQCTRSYKTPKKTRKEIHYDS